MSALITSVEHALATAASDVVKTAKFVETGVLHRNPAICPRKYDGRKGTYAAASVPDIRHAQCVSMAHLRTAAYHSTRQTDRRSQSDCGVPVAVGAHGAWFHLEVISIGGVDSDCSVVGQRNRVHRWPRTHVVIRSRYRVAAPPLYWVNAYIGSTPTMGQHLPWARPRVEKATLSAQSAPECARRWETTTPALPVRSRLCSSHPARSQSELTGLPVGPSPAPPAVRGT
jgi:hypothetical protein